MVKRLLKRLATALALAGMFPFAALCGFGRISGVFQLFAHWAAMFPGMPGDYLRVAYYAMTLESCSLHSRVSFGSFFAQSSVRVGTGVYIGSYCVIGSCEIGDRTQIGSQVQILSGRHQHGVDESGRVLTSDQGAFIPVKVGADCWLGAAAIIMANIGQGTTIGAGSVVPLEISANVIAVGNPAREIKERHASTSRQ